MKTRCSTSPARSAYLINRFMHTLGLHGKSFLPLFLGFGCNVPAVMGARVVESRSGRLLTILLAPLVPCSARLAVLAFLASAFFGDAALPAVLALVGNSMGMDWRMLVAPIAGFVAKENIIATLCILYGADGGGLARTLAAQISPAAALAFLTVTMLYMPCLATVAVMRQEIGNRRWMLFGVALLLAIALGAGILVYRGANLLGMGG
ncbi:MAG: nucleoside recognition domain-containing protein [Gammaproteobacteria bacterium]